MGRDSGKGRGRGGCGEAKLIEKKMLVSGNSGLHTKNTSGKTLIKFFFSFSASENVFVRIFRSKVFSNHAECIYTHKFVDDDSLRDRSDFLELSWGTVRLSKRI